MHTAEMYARCSWGLLPTTAAGTCMRIRRDFRRVGKVLYINLLKTMLEQKW